MRIYFCLGWDSMNSRSIILGLRQFNILISAAALWQARKPKLWRPKVPPHRELLVDSGAFALLSSMPDYPFSLADYLSAAGDLGADWIAARDWPCEPYGRIRVPVPERIRRTVEAAAEIVDAEMPGRARPLPVIQGWAVADYVSCIDQLRERGLIRPRMAVGSCCGRKSVGDVLAIARAVRAELPGTELHYFGLKVTALRAPGFVRLADSIDTGAWQVWNPTGERYAPWVDGRCGSCGKPRTDPGDSPGHLHRMVRSEDRTDRFWRYRRILRPTLQRSIDGPMPP